MGYVSMGDVASDQFNSTKYPGICKPSTASALAIFKRLQTQLNRVAYAKGIATISVDGDLGGGTLGLFAKVKPTIVQYLIGDGNPIIAGLVGAADTSNCSAVASMADVIANAADACATALKSPSSPPAPKPTKQPMLVLADGTEKAPPVGSNLLAAFESAPNYQKFALLGVLGGAAFFVIKKKRRGRR